MAEFQIKKGDVYPRIRMQLKDSAGVAIDLTSSTVAFHMRARAGGALKVSAAATLITPASGIVEYAWSAPDVDTEGQFDAEWVITTSGNKQTVPTAGYVTVTVLPALA